MAHLTRFLVFGALFVGLGCTPKRIPGTEIHDTDETRALLSIMERYRQAVEAKDTDTVMTLIDPSFKDNAGTATPEDDVDYRGLKARLEDRFARVENVKLNFEVKKISVEDDEANAVYSYTSSFRLPSLSQKTMNDSELEQMSFKRQSGRWLITSGI